MKLPQTASDEWSNSLTPIFTQRIDPHFVAPSGCRGVRVRCELAGRSETEVVDYLRSLARRG
jgi:hypothetical protein